jgi:DNA-directed RNA polymerase specialized sigma24 family protein
MDMVDARKNHSAIWESLQPLYETGFYEVAKYISRNGGTIADAEDIFHDAVVVLYQHLDEHKEVDSRLKYLIGVSRNLWAAKLRKHSVLAYKDLRDDQLALTEPTVNQERLLHFIAGIGRHCLDLLASFYFEKLNPEKLMNRFGFSSAHSASVQKFKCIEKLRETIREKSIAYEDFLD